MKSNKNVFATLGASNHCAADRQKDDYYATDPLAVERLLEVEKFNHYIWEPACGEGHISKVLESSGYDVISTDLIYRGFGEEEPLDFLAYDEVIADDIITNPPFKFALEFVQKALSLTKDGQKVAMFLRLAFLEGQKRKTFFEENPPKVIYVFSSRVECAKNGDFVGNCAVAFAWFIWEKGYKGPAEVRWL